MVFNFEEHLFIKTYVDEIEKTEEAIKILAFLKSEERNDLLLTMYVLFTKMAIQSYGQRKVETDKENNSAIEDLIEEDGTMERVVDLMNPE